MKILLGKKKGIEKHEILIDDQDFELINQYVWWVVKGKNGILYARGHLRGKKGEDRKMVFMHQVIMQDTKIDHENRNGLDNQRNNLRKCNDSQNLGNSIARMGRKFKGVFKGVPRARKPWRAQIQVNGKFHCLGHFWTQEEAALAYNEAAKRYFGKFALLNEVSHE